MIIEDDPVRDTQIVDMDALNEALNEEIKAGGSLIIDGHYSHDLLDEEQVSLVVVLRKAPWKLQEILQNRLYSYDKVWENLEAEIMGIIAGESEELFPAAKLHEVDTTDSTPTDSVNEIIQVINGAKPHFEPIDWITYPETLRVLVNRTCTLS